MKKTFKEKCIELEKAGWSLITYEPYAKKAVFIKHGKSKKVSGGA
jgi:hypothetical protein